MAKEQFDFEKNMNRLEEISRLIQDKKMSIDNSTKLYEEAVKLYNDCQNYLKEKELTINVLSQKINEE